MVATVTLSMEIELGWGKHSLASPERYAVLSADRELETETLTSLLSTCDELGIPLTFDIVGHLLLDRCDGSHDGPYPSGWFNEDPGTDSDTSPWFYAPEMVDSIVSARAEHEICTHTFSHIRFNDIGKQIADSDLRRVTTTHKEFGLPAPTSIVPPFHHQNVPKDLLKDHGINCIRLPFPDPPAEQYSIDAVNLLTRGHPLREPQVVDGVLETYCTSSPSLTAATLPKGQKPPHRRWQYVPAALRRQLHYRYLRKSVKKAIETDSYLHLWTHLFNVANKHQWWIVQSLLKLLATYEKQGVIQVRTMSELATEHGVS